MSVEVGKTYTMRMGYGEEIVAKITALDSSTFTLSKPVAVVPGQQGIQLMNSLFTADPESDVTVNRSSVAMIAPVREDVGDSYLEATTGIKPVRSKILMG
jgi:hypothetical protein